MYPYSRAGPTNARYSPRRIFLHPVLQGVFNDVLNDRIYCEDRVEPIMRLHVLFPQGNHFATVAIAFADTPATNALQFVVQSLLDALHTDGFDCKHAINLALGC